MDYSYIQIKCSEQEIDSHLKSSNAIGYELVSCTCTKQYEFIIHELGHREVPARFLLIFKRALLEDD